LKVATSLDPLHQHLQHLKLPLLRVTPTCSHFFEDELDGSHMLHVVLMVLLTAVQTSETVIVLLAERMQTGVLDPHIAVVLIGTGNGWQDCSHNNDNIFLFA
jgi:hypothetical protein